MKLTSWRSRLNGVPTWGTPFKVMKLISCTLAAAFCFMSTCLEGAEKAPLAISSQILAEGTTDTEIFTLLVFSYRNYDQGFILRKSLDPQASPHVAGQITFSKETFIKSRKAKGLSTVSMSISSARWEKAFFGDFEVACEGDTYVLIPFEWNPERGLAVKSDDHWKIVND